MKIECSTGEVVYNYKDYLQTKHWLMKKAEFMKNVKRECVMCQGDKYIHVHHMTYKNVGNEKLDELVYLCWNCHKYLHENISKFHDQKYFNYLKVCVKNNQKKIKVKSVSCNKCIHTTFVKRKRCCDLGYDYSYNKPKRCKMYYTYAK